MLNNGFEYREQVGADAGGVTVADYLARRYPRFSREGWAAHIASGRVLIDGASAEATERLRAGQVVSWLRPPWEEPPAPASFAILHRDAVLLAVAKPRGLPTLPGGGFMDRTLLSIVRRAFPGASPLHRLGRATSGIVLFASTSGAFSIVAEKWRRGEILKVYRALVTGRPERDEWSVDAPIGPVPHPLLGTVHAASAHGKRASSRVKVLERREESAVVQVTITTGRPHQIRIHLAASGHPLVGDPLYVSGGVPTADTRALPGDPGYLLHAAVLGFNHPTTGVWIEIECLPPPPLRVSAS